MLLGPAGAGSCWSERAGLLREGLAGLEQELERATSLPRVTLLETEYLRAVMAAELGWVNGIVDDLRTGALTWSREQIASVAMDDLGVLATDLPPEYTIDAEPARQARPGAGSAR